MRINTIDFNLFKINYLLFHFLELEGGTPQHNKVTYETKSYDLVDPPYTFLQWFYAIKSCYFVQQTVLLHFFFLKSIPNLLYFLLKKLINYAKFLEQFKNINFLMMGCQELWKISSAKNIKIILFIYGSQGVLE